MENLLRFQTEEGDSESDEDYEGMSPIDTAAVFGDPNSPLLGEPVQIVKMAQDGGFEFDADALSSILLKDNIKDKPVVVVSITGDLRKGMSRTNLDQFTNCSFILLQESRLCSITFFGICMPISSTARMDRITSGSPT